MGAPITVPWPAAAGQTDNVPPSAQCGGSLGNVPGLVAVGVSHDDGYPLTGPIPAGPGNIEGGLLDSGVYAGFPYTINSDGSANLYTPMGWVSQPLPPPPLAMNPAYLAHADYIVLNVLLISQMYANTASFDVTVTASDGTTTLQQGGGGYSVPPMQQQIVGPFTFPILSGAMDFTVTIKPYGGFNPKTGAFDATLGYSSWTISLTLFVTYPPIYLDGVNLDLTLDAIPITILYCPPDQDMLNSVEQQSSYGTVISVGNSATTGTFAQNSYGIQGGIQFSVGGPPVPGLDANVGPSDSAGVGGSTSNQTTISSSSQNGVTSMMSFSYLWDTMLVADNQSTIGRKYWGPLGDLFLIVINPQFNVVHSPTSATGDPNGTFYINPGPSYEGKIVILQGYKLLNPTGDPVASQLSANTRMHILQLDPFYVNLAPFFPADGSVPDYSTLDPSSAVDPYIDPSTGSDFTNLGPGSSAPGDNRAAFIAQYSIDNGVEVDLTTTTTLTFEDNFTNQSTYNATVQSSTGNSGSVTFDFLTFAPGSTSINNSSLQLAYQQSFECQYKQISTAKCKLVRNQIEADLDDIQIWWDKQFSTFMFRRVAHDLPNFFGTVLAPPDISIATPKGRAPAQSGLNNVRVTLSMDNITYRTMTDRKGFFRFCNIKESGQYVLTVGNKTQKVKIVDGNNTAIVVKNVKRIVDPKTAPIWELHSIGIPQAHALAIKKELHKKPTVNRKAWEQTCRKHGISIAKLEEKVEFSFGVVRTSPRRRKSRSQRLERGRR